VFPATRRPASDEGQEARLWHGFLDPRWRDGNEGQETGPDRAISELALRWHGVVTTRQLLDAGISGDGINHRVKHRRLVRLHRGVYQVGPIAAPYGREMAALLALGDGAALSHHTAAAIWGFRAAHEGDVHVTIKRGRGASRPGIRVHRTRSLKAAVKDGLRLTTPTRTLLDLAPQLSQHDLDCAVEQALVNRLTTHDEIERACRTARKGAARLRAALLTEPGLTRSEAERRLRKLIRAAGLPRPVSNTRVAGWEVDVLWPEHKLVVEVDGFAFHGSRHAFERDRRKDADLVAAGYRVVRFTWRQIVHEPEVVIARLAVLLHAAATMAA
jgi:very-short-patch-repair endonuclease